MLLALIAAWLVTMELGALPPSPPMPQPDQGSQYEVCFHHTLRNRTDRELRDVRIYIPIPQNDSYQHITDFRMEFSGPAEVSNRTDEFGNKLKRIEIPMIPPKGEIDVGYSCILTLAAPARVLLASSAGILDDIPPAIREKYTRDHNIFRLSSPIIREHAERLLREHPDPAARAKAIHDLVASTIKYDSGGGWDPAPEVLTRGRGSCSEFAYAFCALCRATGIPTRFVGASIFPVKSSAPFTDGGHHRWAQAYLPRPGWVDFDPSLDAGRIPKQQFVGTHHGRTLIVSRIGDKPTQLGLAYVSSNSHTSQTTRSQKFVWSQGAAAKLEEAKVLLAKGAHARGQGILRDLIQNQKGTRAAMEAQKLLE